MFDTILWRTVPRPTDAFIILGRRLLEAELIDPTVDPYIFRRLRIEAEKRARIAKAALGGGHEVTLREIWSQFSDHLLIGSREMLAEREFQVERQVTVPDLDIADLVAHAAARGIRMAIVSNTYFTAQDLIRLVSRPHLEPLASARVFASSAFGVNKSDGLWKIVLADLGVPPSSVVHVGDEVLSDSRVPVQMGIRVAPFYRLYPGVLEPLEREGALLPDPASPSVSNVDPVKGDCGITGIRTKVTARAESGDLPGDLNVAWRFGAAVMGPVLTGYANWVQDQASRLGVNRVWCPMREGDLLAELINNAAPPSGGVEATPLWLSRQVTSRALITEVTQPVLRQFAERRRSPTLGQLLRTLGVEEEEVPDLRSVTNHRVDSPGTLDRAVEVLTRRPHLRARILEESKAARARLLRYVNTMTGGMQEPIVLADLGWGGTIQVQLERALKLSGVNVRVAGLYLATNEGAIGRVLQGSEIYGYLTSCGVPDLASQQISRTPEVIEQVCVATIGSVVDFTESGEPVLDSSVPPPEQAVQKAVAQHGIRSFQREWLRYRDTVPEWAVLDGAERPLLLNILTSSVARPTIDESRVFGSWDHDDNFGTEETEAVVPERLRPYVPYLSPPDVLEMTSRDNYWPLGLIGRHDPDLLAAVNAVRDGGIASSAFESNRMVIKARLEINSGAGFSSVGEKGLRYTKEGLSYLHFSCSEPSIAALRLHIGERPAVVRVDWIELEADVMGSAEIERVRVPGDTALARFSVPGSTRVEGGVMLGVGAAPALEIPMEALFSSPVYNVDVRFAGAVLALPDAPVSASASPAAGRGLTQIVGKARREAAAGGAPAVMRGAFRVLKRWLSS